MVVILYKLIFIRRFKGGSKPIQFIKQIKTLQNVFIWTGRIRRIEF